jgi:hypothetical protein
MKLMTTASVKDSGEKPLSPELIELISPGARVLCIHTDEKTHRFTVPPLGRFSPPTDNIENSIETLSPDEGSYCRAAVLVDFDRFINKSGHGIDSKKRKGIEL